jgi:hypothetical protein
VRARARALFAIDLRSLALFRIVAGLILLFDLGDRARLLAANYTDAGVYPRELALAHQRPGLLPSLHLMAGSEQAQLVLFAAGAGAALLLALGWRTRVATAVSWFLLASLHARNELVTDGGDHVLRHLLFWCLFLPLGARWSLDARRRGPPDRTDVSSPASAALLLQIASVFLVTGLAKTGPEWTTDHTAIEYAIARKWWILPFGEWLLAHPPLPALLTPAVRWWEILGPFLLFSPVANAPLRVLATLGFWALLAGLGLGLSLHLFPFITGAGLLPFLPGPIWDWLGRRIAPLRATPEAARPARAGRGAAALAGNAVMLALLILLVGWMNARTLRPSLSPPAPLERVAHAARIGQGWLMYAPSPRHVDVWFEHRGRLANGNPVDLDRASGGAGWTEVKRAWADYRFLFQLQKLAAPKWHELVSTYARWLCRQWNQDRRGGARLELVTVSVVIEPIALHGEPEQPAETKALATTLCPR